VPATLRRTAAVVSTEHTARPLTADAALPAAAAAPARTRAPIAAPTIEMPSMTFPAAAPATRPAIVLAQGVCARRRLALPTVASAPLPSSSATPAGAALSASVPAAAPNRAAAAADRVRWATAQCLLLPVAWRPRTGPRAVLAAAVMLLPTATATAVVTVTTAAATGAGI
jgi:hypothetical protein